MSRSHRTSQMNRAWLQKEFCTLNGYARYAPSNGRCWHCGENIYKRITNKRAASELIVSCPACHEVFVD